MSTSSGTPRGMLGSQFPKAQACLPAGASDFTVIADFPVSHRKMIRSTNPLERLIPQSKRLILLPDLEGRVARG